MKKVNFLSKAEMKNVMGGLENVSSGLCGNWANSAYDICLNCCVSWSDQQPNPDSDPTGVGYCDSICSR